MHLKIPTLIGLDNHHLLVNIGKLKKDEIWFFLGDIHGDSECLKWAFRYIQNFKGFRLCLLGDVFDRGDDEADCFEMILKFSNKHPGKVMWLAGNHDRPIGKSLTPRDWPSDLIDLRNELMPRLPFMALFSEDMIAMHGGPPSTAMLKRDNCRKFLMTSEICEATKKSRFIALKNPEEDANHEHWFDANDLLAFTKYFKLPTALKTLIRGHDHPPGGYHLYSDSSGVKILTLLASSKIGVQFMPEQHRDWTTLAQLDISGQLVAKKVFCSKQHPVFKSSI